ncbi:class I SAM-dependent methyltransferase [Actinoallomurus liliacearum]|uniref:Class I SAM-dependent methyltransferase n=1 Tax=Actinoallomurus liliacearum TaxID=1080073 RepID=A0ABP8TN24_9ACTN
MDRQEISAIAHGDHPIAAPISDESVGVLLDRALRRSDERVLDLGCGAGTWLIRALADRPGLRAVGVDTDASAIARAEKAATAAGVADRVVFHAMDAKDFTAPNRFDLVLSVGAAHAFGGLLPTLDAAAGHLASDGGLLVGDGFWERPPGRATLDAGFEAEEYDDLATTVDRITDRGWVPIYGHVSTRQEWDDYEWSWTGTLSRWALEHPEHPDSDQALRAAAEHRTDWLHGYRGTFGFLTLCLRRAHDR